MSLHIKTRASLMEAGLPKIPRSCPSWSLSCWQAAPVGGGTGTERLCTRACKIISPRTDGDEQEGRKMTEQERLEDADPEQLSAYMRSRGGMTEHEWQECYDPMKLRGASRATATDRKDRLFMAAFWYWHGRLLAADMLIDLARFADEWAERGEYPVPLLVNTILEDGEPVRKQVDRAIGKPFANYDAQTTEYHARIL